MASNKITKKNKQKKNTNNIIKTIKLSQPWNSIHFLTKDHHSIIENIKLRAALMIRDMMMLCCSAKNSIQFQTIHLSVLAHES